MQALEWREDQVIVPLIDAEPIVLNADNPIRIIFRRTNIDPRRDAIPPVLQGIGKQVLKHVGQLRSVAADNGEFTGMDLRASVSYELPKILNCAIENGA